MSIKRITSLAVAATVAVVLAVGMGGCDRNSNPSGGGGGGGGGGDDIPAGESATVKDGVIELGGAKLNFGANNVTSGAKMTALKHTEAQKPEGLVSTLFELELTPECKEPVTVSIPVNTSQIPEESVVLLGIGNIMDASDGYGDTIYGYYPVTINGGVATASFIPADHLQDLVVKSKQSGVKHTPSREKLAVGMFWFNFSTTQLASDGHFIVYFKGFTFPRTDRLAFLDDLESIYQYYYDKGYRYTKRKSWPMEIYVEKLSAKGYYVFRENGYMQLNKDLFAGGYKRTEVKSIAAHEFFHFVQYNYYQSRFSDNLWFDEATATYFEVKNGGIASLVGENFDKMFLRLWPADDRNASKQEGYARGPLVGFLADRFEENFILKTYQAASAEDYPFMSFILRDSLPSIHEWVADYYESVVTGKNSVYTVMPNTLVNHVRTNPDFKDIGKVLNLTVPNKQPTEAQTPMGENAITLSNHNVQFVPLILDADNRFNVSALDECTPVVSIEGEDAEHFVDLRVIEYRSRDITVHKADNVQIILTDYREKVIDGFSYIVMATGTTAASGNYKIKVEMQGGVWRLDPPEGHEDALFGQEYAFKVHGDSIPKTISQVEIVWDYGDGKLAGMGTRVVPVIDGQATCDIPPYAYVQNNISERKPEYKFSVLVYKHENGKSDDSPIARLDAPVKMVEYVVSLGTQRSHDYEMPQGTTEENAGADHTFNISYGPEGEYTWTLDYGDGTTPATGNLTGPPRTFTQTHRYNGVGSWNPKVTLLVNGVAVAEDEVTVNVKLPEVTPPPPPDVLETVLMPDGKTWTKRNLNVATDSSWCYDNSPSNCATYGRLYTWGAAVKACAGLGGGWRLPSSDEWTALTNAVGSNVGTKLKSTTGWTSNTSFIPTGTDQYGFSALPGGGRNYSDGNDDGNDGYFFSIGDAGYWWTATEIYYEDAYERGMFSDNEYVHENWSGKDFGYSVRCIRD